MQFKSLTAATAAAVVILAAPAIAAGKYHSVYTFTGADDGGFPQGGVIADASGALYGTTTSDGADHSGVVYRLSPPAPGKTHWKQSVLYTFTGGNDGATPNAALLMDNSGALYGVTYAGGANGYGVVFKLTPPAQGQTTWTQSVLWTFTGGNDGGEPQCALIEDASGNLYGTTTLGGTGVVGTVFELSPPAQGKTAWTESVLYNFTGNDDGGEPFGNVLFGPDDSLYGTSAGYGKYNYGTVYRLSAPKKGSTWEFHLVHAFKGGNDGEVPRDGLIEDSSGALYGTTAGFDDSLGTVFKLTQKPGGEAWKQEVLYHFTGQGYTGNGPWQTVSIDKSGALYGTTLADGRSMYGEIFKLTPPAQGAKKWHAKVLHVFQAGPGSQFPYSNVLIGADGTTLYGTTQGSAGESGFYPGNVWQITQ